MSLKNLHYALLLDEHRKELKPEEKEKIRRQIRKDSRLVIENLLDLLEKSIDKINKTD